MHAHDRPKWSSTYPVDRRLKEVEHWALVAASMLMILAASLAKEIGITTIAAVVLYDIFLIPFDVILPPGR